eukprot:15482206-Alexandrium_andersonii.AAC.1
MSGNSPTQEQEYAWCGLAFSRVFCAIMLVAPVDDAGSWCWRGRFLVMVMLLAGVCDAGLW